MTTGSDLLWDGFTTELDVENFKETYKTHMKELSATHTEICDYLVLVKKIGITPNRLTPELLLNLSLTAVVHKPSNDISPAYRYKLMEYYNANERTTNVRDIVIHLVRMLKIAMCLTADSEVLKFPSMKKSSSMIKEVVDSLIVEDDFKEMIILTGLYGYYKIDGVDSELLDGLLKDGEGLSEWLKNHESKFPTSNNKYQLMHCFIYSYLNQYVKTEVDYLESDEQNTISINPLD